MGVLASPAKPHLPRFLKKTPNKPKPDKQNPQPNSLPPPKKKTNPNHTKKNPTQTKPTTNRSSYCSLNLADIMEES